MRRWAGPAALVVLCAALLGVGVDQGLRWHRATDRVDRGRAAVAAAEREVVALISVSSATSRQDLDRVRAGATGDFGRELARQSTAFTSALRDHSVHAQGRVVSSGLASLSGSRATVLVAATGTVSNTAATAPSSRTYRLRASLTRTAGRWLVSSLEFVP